MSSVSTSEQPVPVHATAGGVGRPTGRRPALDGIRALAILAVFGSHTPYRWLKGGWVGVEVFFVLSGYLITTLLLREWQTSGGIGFGRFYLRRVLRLYPALIVLLIAGIALYTDLGVKPNFHGYVVAAAAAGAYVEDFVWGFLHSAGGGFGHTWSLAVEEQFYLLWPPVLLLLLRGRRSPLRMTLAGVFVSLWLAAFTTPPVDLPGTYFLPWIQAAPLLAGCSLSLWMAQLRAGPTTALTNRPWGAIGGVAVGLLVLVTVAAAKLSRGDYLAELLALASLLTCLLVMAIEVDATSVISRVLAWKPLAGLGLISYGFYLYHLVVIEAVNAHLHVAVPLRMTVALAITLACALASYRFVETPFLRLKDRLHPSAPASVTLDRARERPRL